MIILNKETKYLVVIQGDGVTKKNWALAIVSRTGHLAAFGGLDACAGSARTRFWARPPDPHSFHDGQLPAIRETMIEARGWLGLDV